MQNLRRSGQQSRPQSRVPFGQRHGTKALAMSNEIPVLIGFDWLVQEQKN